MTENKSFVLDDSEQRENIGEGNECYSCKHSTDHGVCSAFTYIPDDIWSGKVSHRQPYPGDNGIQFEKIVY
ncbi:MAG TPA: hypothetical protein PK079_07375 [Leptospiraceae bacterium]|nr:hypothetical protein [Leptospiraceae bacterium]HMY33339.1 hypothetical protein [Leptospiraceae bacterium]HMZ66213.1 hypothetical protein [Leptospiraceae bacterium]HNA07524.1 hypothetical protein [Leptospiraceae bacterium]HNB98060.1 hypothetical protein [Leptospiraceae bacterium]